MGVERDLAGRLGGEREGRSRVPVGGKCVSSSLGGGPGIAHRLKAPGFDVWRLAWSFPGMFLDPFCV